LRSAYAPYNAGMSSRYFAIVPAAGLSVRMGRAKLLLPLAGRPLIWHAIEAWRASGVDRVVVVLRPGDEELAEVLREIVRSRVQGPKSKVGARHETEADLVVPEAPPVDMKASVRAALMHVERTYSPEPHDAFLLAPADMPRLSAAMVRRLIESHSSRTNSESAAKILAPSLAGKRGHPVLFSWRLAAEVFALADGEGLDAIVRRHEPRLVACDDLAAAGEQPFADVDTPEEYGRMTRGE
jgi:molybdenum cofactor cytidylyltransferase